MKELGGRIHTYYGATESLQKYSGGSAYSDLIFFIKQAVKMNDEEAEAYKHICELLKKDRNLIKNYLLSLKCAAANNASQKTECEVKRKMAVLEKNRKLELLDLLNTTEQKVIAEIVKGTEFNKIAQNVGITDGTFSCIMSGIYKKTSKFITYEQRVKKTALYGYIFGKCGFAHGEELIIKSDTTKKTVIKKSEVKVDKLKVQETLAPKAINDNYVLTRTLNILYEKFDECCLTIGKEAVMGNVQKAIESEMSRKGRGYGNAIEVLTMLRKDLGGERC